MSEGGVRNAMNIWGLERDQSIRHLLLLLVAQLGEGAFEVDLQIPTDSRAIFIRDPQQPALCAYLYTVGQEAGRYGVHLEYPPGSSGGNLFEAQENVSLAALVEMLAAHFDVAIIAPLPGH